jgi:uncharacterized protein (TIGR02246 family)
MSSHEINPASVEPDVALTYDAPPLRAEIAAANARFMDAFGAGHATGVAACYTASGQLLPPGSDVVTGREAITRFWSAVMAAGIAAARLDTVELEGRGDLAVEVGRYALSGADGGVIDHGKYVVVWKRTDGEWRIHRDIWSTSIAPKAS